MIAAVATVIISRAALLDMLTTAAALGRDIADKLTRGDVADALALYGFSDDRLDRTIARTKASVADA